MCIYIVAGDRGYIQQINERFNYQVAGSTWIVNRWNMY